MSRNTGGIDLGSIQTAAERQSGRVTPGIGDITAYVARGVVDTSHRDVIGPLLPGTGASGVVVHRGKPIATWGNPTKPEMAFSVSKTMLSIVAGAAFDRGLLDPDEPVVNSVDLPVHRQLTWEHLLQQTSQWDGELWGKPTYVDANGKRLGSVIGTAEPGTGWAYNDVRVNLLGLALTLLFRRPLPDVLHDCFLQPLGSSGQWSWHGYDSSFVTIYGREIQVVSGGAHWGGGVWMSADDIALFGQLYLQHGRWRGAQLVSEQWIGRSWLPCAHKPEYGYMWWLNDNKRIFPTAPATARCARGNADRHLLWVDPARDLVIASHWGEGIFRLLEEVSLAIPERNG